MTKVFEGAALFKNKLPRSVSLKDKREIQKSVSRRPKADRFGVTGKRLGAIRVFSEDVIVLANVSLVDDNIHKEHNTDGFRCEVDSRSNIRIFPQKKSGPQGT